MDMFYVDPKLSALFQALSFFVLIAYVSFVVWAVVRSSRRWITLLAMVVSVVVGFLVAFEALAHSPEFVSGWADFELKMLIAWVLAVLVSGGVGWKYLKTHRPTPAS